MRVTRATVAKEAGVTPNTVSCVLNNIRPVSKEVRERVMKAVEKLNYVADFTSRAMLGKKTKQIVVVVEDLTNPFYSSMVSNIEKVFSTNGYSVSISSDHNLEKNISVFLARRVDAVYFCSGFGKEQAEQLFRLTEEGVKILLNPSVEFTGSRSTIDMETSLSAKKAVDYFVSKGHKNIAFLTSLAEGIQLDGREKTFVETMEGYGLTPKVVRVNQQNNHPTLELGKKLFETLIKEKVEATAIFAIDDIVAIGAMLEAERLGFKIPEDYSFIGIDGIELGKVFHKKLATFKCDMEDFANNVYRIIINMIEKDEREDFVQTLIFDEGETVLDKIKK